MAERDGITQTPAAVEVLSEIAGDLYVIDGRASRFTVRAFASGLLSAMGHNPVIGIRDFSGEIRFDAEKVEAGSFRFLIKAASLNVQDDISDKDRREMERLMHQEVLESSKFPEIRYEGATATVTKVSDMLYSATLSGDLSLHGVTRSQPLSARVTLFGSMLRASGDFTLSQTDYNIRLVSVAGGALKLKDELKFSFEVVARRE